MAETSVHQDPKSMDDRGIIMLSEDIENGSCAKIIEFVMNKNISPKGIDYITLIVSSWGGSVYAAFGLTDVMEGSKLPVHTVGLGMIASAGLLIFMAGDKGNRILTPNTAILSHQFFGFDFGKEHELLACRRNNDLTTTRIMRHYRKHTELSDSDIREKLLPPEDVWLTAREAKKLGLCDDIRLV